MNNKSKAEAILVLVREIDSLENEKQLLQKQLDAIDLNGSLKTPPKFFMV